MTCLRAYSFIYIHEWFSVPGQPGILAVTMLGLQGRHDLEAPCLMKKTDFGRLVNYDPNVHIVDMVSCTSGLRYSVVKMPDESYKAIKVKKDHTF